MQVLKFGGSSVADATRISRVIDIVEAAAMKDRVILVCSAISGCTDKLLAIAANNDPKQRVILIDELREQHRSIVRRLFTGKERRDMVAELDTIFEDMAGSELSAYVSFGEILSTRIIARKIACEDIRTLWLDSRQIIKTVSGQLDTDKSYHNILSAVTSHSQIRVFVAPGFIASDEHGRVTTLGRGGSDYSAALYAAGSKADTLEIWTDVPGIMTANPKIVPSARSVTGMSYRSALDLAENGAKVLYAPTVKPAMEAGISFSIRNTFDPSHPGTIVSDRPAPSVTQWMGVTSREIPQSEESVICLVGESVKSRDAVALRMSLALSEAGIDPLGEVYGREGVFFIKVRTVIVNEAVSAVHREFFESRALNVIDIYIAGYGAVGKALSGMVSESAERIAARTGRSIRIAGVSNSRHFILDKKGISPDRIEELLPYGQSAAGGAFVEAVASRASRKSVFVDCTDDHGLYLSYETLFRRGINVVTSNRRSLAVPYAHYASMKATARENGVFFRYDTTVGNSLPILESIASGANCSDGIISIEAVVSCTLNYIITEYDGERTDSFGTLLKRAQDSGLTEPDPRIDLGGKDALRKLLILGREAGVKLEASDVEITPMLPREFFDCQLDDFYKLLAEYEPKFIARENELDEMGMRQRFVASLRRDPSSAQGYKAEIKMQLVGPESPFFWISGTENVTVITSEQSAPLVIKGAGEGVKLAASGIIKDILS